MSGHAVVDVESTGLGRTDRIVEVGVVLMDDSGREVDTFTTLVNPGRDIGGSGIHGITASDVVGAPRFGVLARYLDLAHGVLPQGLWPGSAASVRTVPISLFTRNLSKSARAW